MGRPMRMRVDASLDAALVPIGPSVAPECRGGDGRRNGWLYQGVSDTIDNCRKGINGMSTSGFPDLTSRQLETVLALAEYGSFIAAAALLRTSQPAVTRTLKHVEEVLGIRLFERSTRSVQITPAGKEFVGVATRVLNDLRITINSMRELSDQRRGQVI